MLKRVLPGGLRRRLGYLRRRGRLYARWLRHEVPHDPRHEFYARRQSLIDRKVFQADQKAGAAAVQRTLEPFRHVMPPKVIWMYWHQGEAEAPLVVARCIESWRRHNPGWEVRVLDAQTVTKYADISHVPKALSFRFSANLLRLKLLKTYGGVWSDATVYCHRPLDDWLPLHMTTGFFGLRDPGPARWIASWFLISEPGHILPSIWEAAYDKYIRRLKYVPDIYFVFFYLFQWRLTQEPKAMEAFRQFPGLPARPSFFMMQVLLGVLPEERLHEMLDTGLPVSKLSWKKAGDPAEFMAFCDRLDTHGAGVH